MFHHFPPARVVASLAMALCFCGRKICDVWRVKIKVDYLGKGNKKENTMQIVAKFTNDLKPYDKNPRKNDEAVKLVKKSIEEFGFKVPIVIDKDDVIVCGHTRWKAARALRLEQVPCVVADDLSEEQIKAFRLADNKVGEIAEWDIDLLKVELDELDELGVNMEDFGFVDLDFGDDSVAEEDDFDADAAVEEIKEPITKVGDIWKLGNHRLICGDSTSRDCVETLLCKTKAHLLLTDPPYGINIVKNSNRINSDKVVPKKGVVGVSVIAKARKYSQILNDESTDCAKCNYLLVKEYSENQIIFGGNYFTDFLPPKGCWLVWDKKVPEGMSFADVELAWTSFDKGSKLYSYMWTGMKREGRRDLELKERVHPTQKPVGMLVDIIKDFTKENDNILDCFGGSGSTLIACEQTNRNCYMIELDPHYCDVIVKRWETLTGKKAERITGE